MPDMVPSTRWCSKHLSRAVMASSALSHTGHLRRRQTCLFQAYHQWSHRRCLQTSALPPRSRVADFAFAFDIDGVLLRSAHPLPRATKALSVLQKHNIPFILLTNGGGRHEDERVQELSRKLEVQLDVSMLVQSHTPFAGMAEGLQDKCVLVVGGEGDRCRRVAERYGFKNVVTPGDILTANPEIWPFSKILLQHYRSFARPLPRPILIDDPSRSLKIDAILVFNDPRDWGLDITIILDVLLSIQGIVGTYSPKNKDSSLSNRGFQQDGQPKVYFSNPDLLWAAGYNLPRLGQGGFREALEGVWAAVTGGGVQLQKKVIGKPFHETFSFAEKLLVQHRKGLLPVREREQEDEKEQLKRVYMIGDNPESDIRGANEYRSPWGTEWYSVLVCTGVFNGREEPTWKPKVVVEDVWDAVEWGLAQSRWDVQD